MSFTYDHRVAIRRPPIERARLERARAAFRLFRPGEERQRATQIAALPQVAWRGRALYTLRCQGDFGRGPHDVNVPEAHLWALIDFRAFRCPFHA